MPYWTSSRVGAVPQGQPTKRKGRNERHNRKKGITMEDLKKQTAMRLAQEQKQHQSRPGGTPSYATTPPAVSQQEQQPPQQQSYGVVVSPNSQVGSSPPDHLMTYGHPLQQHQQLQQHHHQQHVQHLQHAVVSSSPSPVSGVSAVPHSPYQPQIPPEQMVVPPVQYPYDPTAAYLGLRPMMESPMMPNQVACYQQQQPPATKSKLPHGLTVSELKEMTKARLQAEAADKKDHSETSELREPPMNSASPLPHSSSYHRTRSYSQSRGDAWSNESRAETWESGSVSTACSDYLGSESPYGAGSFGGEEASPSPFNGRHVSFPNSATPTGKFSDSSPPDSVALPSVFPTHPDSSSGFPMNRYRAATLSPRGLSHVDEHRQFVISSDTPSLPTFSTPCNRNYRSRVSFNNDRLLTGPLTGNFESNRPRTNSAVSLPPISHTAEEFSMELCAASNSFNRLPSTIGSLREDTPSPSVTGLADVFRESPARFASPPPGFASNINHVANRPRFQTATCTGFAMSPIDCFGEARARAATWSEPSTDSLFGPALLGAATTPEDDICADLTSILKLSGTEDDNSKPFGTASFYPPPGL